MEPCKPANQPKIVILFIFSELVHVTLIAAHKEQVFLSFFVDEACPCPDEVTNRDYEISKACLPPVYSFSVYTVHTKSHGVTQSGTRCITVIPGENMKLSVT